VGSYQKKRVHVANHCHAGAGQSEVGMKVIGFAGYSGSGKTTLVEAVVALMRERGLKVSVVKHAHHRFDVDREGKDSWRHRKAGAYEVLLASDRRLALMREFEQPMALSVHDMLAELDPRVDWVLVEGFKHGDVPKIEVWRDQPDRVEQGKRTAPLYPHDERVLAVATDVPRALPVPPRQPVLDLNRPAQVLQWLLEQGEQLAYRPQDLEKQANASTEKTAQAPG
jgi:molybdopterin-guanine dinucleotide biosynthesis protein B